MTMILPSFLALLPRILLGWWITILLWPTTEKKLVLIKFFICGPLGFGVSSLLAFAWIWVGFSLSKYIFLEAFLVAGFTAWMFFKHRRRLFSFTGNFAAKSHANVIWLILLLTGCSLLAAKLILTALRYPHGRMDAWTQWNVVARFIYLGGSHWQSTFLRQLGHADYPLFLAMTNAITWTITRTDTIWGPIAFHFLIAFFMAGLLFALLNLLAGFKQAALATIIFVTQPIVAGIGMNQYADALISFFFLATGGLTVLYFSLREKRLALAVGLLAGLAGWTKNEGMILVLSCTVVWAIIALTGDWQGCKNYLLGLVFPLLVIVLFKIYLAPKSDLVSDFHQTITRIHDIARYSLIENKASRMAWGIGEGPLSIPGLLLIYSIFVGKTKNIQPRTWAIAILIFLQLTAYFGTYLITPYPLEWHLDTSIDRVLYHVFPLALFWAFIYLRTPDEIQPLSQE